MILARDVSIKVGEFSMSGINLSVNNVKALILGPNGSGKTTLLRAISGLIPYEGSITIDNVEVKDAGGCCGFQQIYPRCIG